MAYAIALTDIIGDYRALQVSDVIAILLQVFIPVVLLVALSLSLRGARSRRWAADHPNLGRRFAIVGLVLGLTGAIIAAGILLGWW